jgi:hypothetical protein
MFIPTGSSITKANAFSGRSLERVLERLECPHAHMHSAGNDANFTLRALLLLGVATYSSRYEHLEDETWKMLDKLWDVAYLAEHRLLTRPRRRRRKLQLCE